MNAGKGKIETIAYGCFCLGVAVEALLVLVDKSAYTNPLEGQIFRLTFLLFLVKVLLTRYSLKEYAVIFLFCLLGAVSYLATGRNEILRTVIFIAACKNVDMKRCLKAVFYLTLAGCAAIMLLALTGLYGTVSLTQEYGRSGTETRYVLGMGHPNALQCMVFMLTVLGLYLHGEKIKWYSCGILLLVNGGFFLLTGSRTSFLAAAFTIVFMYVTIRFKKIQKYMGYAGILLAAASVGFSVFVAANAYRLHTYAWHGGRSKLAKFLWALDQVLSRRMYNLVENEGFEGTIGTWTLLSSPARNYYFDLGWIRLFYWYGILPGTVFVAALLFFMVYCLRKKDMNGLVLLMSLAVYTFAEAHIISVYLARNYMLFLFGMYWYRACRGKVPGREKYIWKIVGKG